MTIRKDNLMNFISEIEEELVIMKDKLDYEKSFNNSMLSKYQGKGIVYGDKIQLMHYETQGFMKGHKIEVSEHDKSALKLSLSDELSSAMIFQIIPRFKVHKNGDIITFADSIIIQNVDT